MDSTEITYSLILLLVLCNGNMGYWIQILDFASTKFSSLSMNVINVIYFIIRKPVALGLILILLLYLKDRPIWRSNDYRHGFYVEKQ